MAESRRYIGLNEFVDEVCEVLSKVAGRRRYRSRGALVQAVARDVDSFLNARMEPLNLKYTLCQDVAEMDSPGIRPAYALGAEFIPDLVVDVSDRPTLAMCIRQMPGDPARQIRMGIGEAIIFSQHYPAVIAFFYGDTPYSDGMSYLRDLTLRKELWHSYKIRLLTSHTNPLMERWT